MNSMHIIEYRDCNGGNSPRRCYDLAVTGKEEMQNSAKDAFLNLLSDITISKVQWKHSTFVHKQTKVFTFTQKNTMRWSNECNEDPFTGINSSFLHVSLLNEMNEKDWKLLNYSWNSVNISINRPSIESKDCRPNFKEREWTFQKESKHSPKAPQKRARHQ